MRRRLAAVAALAAAAAVAGCGGSSSGGGASLAAGSSPTPHATPVAGSAGLHCSSASASPPAKQTFHAEPPLTIARTTYVATVATNCGTIVVDLDGKHAPHTVNSFAFLAAHHYFDNTRCHRLTTAGIYVLQCGDPTGTGTGGPGYTIPDENLQGATYPAGTVAMANTGQPHSGGSQFFFVYADTQLPPSYTPFGRVVSGLGVLKAIAAAGTDNANGSGDGAPIQPVLIKSFTVTKKP